MLNLDRLSIGTRLTLGFLVIMVFASLAGIGSIVEVGEVASHTEQLYKHPLTVGYTMRDIKADILTIRVLMHELPSDADLAQVETTARRVDDLEEKIYREFDLIMERYLGDKRDVQIARDAYSQWKPIRDEKIRMLREGGKGYSEEEFQKRVTPLVWHILEKTQVMVDFSAAKAKSFMEKAKETYSSVLYTMSGLLGLTLLVGMASALFTSRGITTPLAAIVAAMRQIAAGDFSRELEIRRGDEIGVLADAFRDIQKSLREKTALTEAIAAGDFSSNAHMASERDILGKAIYRMTMALRQAKLQNDRSHWIKSGLNELAARLTGESDARALAGKVLGFLAPYLGVQIATLYLLTEERKLVLHGSYAFNRRKGLADAIDLGEGLVGQAALEREFISITDIPEDYLRVNSSLGDSAPRNVLAMPFLKEKDLIGILEMGSFEEFSEDKIEFLRLASESLAMAFDSIGKQERMRELLERTQVQARQLLEQQEELRASNEELEEHAQSLRRSEEELKHQQEELQAMNEELEEKNSYLEQQKSLIMEKNSDLENARRDIERKAAELEVTSKYKSEFLANMSHELRTPLNSLLLLARHLRDNSAGRLSEEEVESAGIIYKNGNDLLALINDILDLSKIEAGRLDINPEPVNLAEMAQNIVTDFRHMAGQKGLALEVDLQDDLPAAMSTDPQRLAQILRNLMSNAVKFTEKGSVSLRIHRPGPSTDLSRSGLDPGETVAFTVSDTGIGIPAEKHREIFEAFQQVDGSTSRRYGGTGLGLSITRELVRLLGGEVVLESEPGKGSAFTVYLPVAGRAVTGQSRETVEAQVQPRAGIPRMAAAPAAPVSPPSISDDRETLEGTEKVILIVEDDPHFARILSGLCRAKGFKTLAAATGEEGLELVEKYLPTAVILDIRLPGINGWTVLNTMKQSHRTRHIPVHVISAHNAPLDALVMGAVGFLNKPVSREDLDAAIEKIEAVVEKKVKDLLLVEDNAELRRGILELVGDLGVNVTEVESGGQALEAIRNTLFDCIILDLGLADMSGLELLKRLEQERDQPIPPVIVYTGKDLTKAEEKELRAYADSIIVKGVRSEDRLLDEVTLFLHRMVSSLPRSKQRMIIDLHNRDAALDGRKILAVDDDMRNLFAVSRVLEEKGMTVLKAEDGMKSLELLDANPDVDLVLLDIMMPVMDGYETLRRLREQPRFARLPVIALTAKAMKEDREKCIAAGASDYLAKPVDVDKMLSMLRVWLYNK